MAARKQARERDAERVRFADDDARQLLKNGGKTIGDRNRRLGKRTNGHWKASLLECEPHCSVRSAGSSLPERSRYTPFSGPTEPSGRRADLEASALRRINAIFVASAWSG